MTLSLSLIVSCSPSSVRSMRAYNPSSIRWCGISLGAILVPHGYDKLFLAGAANTARNPLLKVFGDPLVGAYFIGCVEFFGGLLLILGLFTRFAAGAVAIQMFVISFFILWPVWGWTQRGMEFAIFMMLIAVAIFIRGGGNLSLDSRLPKEL